MPWPRLEFRVRGSGLFHLDCWRVKGGYETGGKRDNWGYCIASSLALLEVVSIRTKYLGPAK